MLILQVPSALRHITPELFVPDKSGLQPEGLLPARGMAGSGLPPLSKIPHCCLPYESGPCLSSSVAGCPLRPAIDRRLGGPLPRQQANQSSAAPSAPGLAVPGFHPQVLCGISQPFGWLSPTNGHVPMYYSPVRHSPPGASSRAAVRLACVRHAASVQSEPGSNSSLESCFLVVLKSLAETDRDKSQSFLWLKV